jgi:hypothetical protein
MEDFSEQGTSFGFFSLLPKFQMFRHILLIYEKANIDTPKKGGNWFGIGESSYSNGQ